MPVAPADRLVDIYEFLDPVTMECRYVGQSVDAQKRRSKHLSRARRGEKRIHSSNWIRSLMDAGQEPVLRIIERCRLDVADVREKFWIAQRRLEGCDLTNHTEGGGGSTGYKHTEESRAKISRAKMGVKTGPMSEETKAKMSRAALGKKKGPMPEYHRAKIGRAGKGKHAGEKQGRAILTNAQAREIRALVAGGARQCDVAVQFGASRSIVSNVVLGKSYKDC